MPVLLSMMGRVRLRSSTEQSWQSRVRSWCVRHTSWQFWQLRTNTLRQPEHKTPSLSGAYASLSIDKEDAERIT
jgi:hypothetical protein